MKIRLRYVALGLLCGGMAVFAMLNTTGPQSDPGIGFTENTAPEALSQRAETTLVYTVNPAPQSRYTTASPEPVVDMRATRSSQRAGSGADQHDCVADLEEMAQIFAIRFDRDDSRIDAQGRDILRVVGTAARACPQAHVVLGGHADASGDEADNRRISWARADAAMATLRVLKLDGFNVEPRGFGAQEPYAQGDAGEDAENRRVDFRVIRVDSRP